jgi:iron uptake system component EfeO
MRKLKFLILVIAVVCLVASGAIVATAQPNSYNAQVQEGVSYFRKQATAQLPLVENLLTALNRGDVNAAKAAYVLARPPYEEIETYALSFEQEDADIDARPYAIEGGETSPDFRGFHRIEALLYRDNNPQAAIPYAKELIKSVKSLSAKLGNPKNFNASLNFQGMINLATEIPAKKISSEEETWSDQSLLIFRHNWIGIHSQFLPYKPLLNKAIADEVENAHQNCLKTIAPFGQNDQYIPYSQVGVNDRREISRVAYRYRDALLRARSALKIPAPKT